METPYKCWAEVDGEIRPSFGDPQHQTNNQDQTLPANSSTTDSPISSPNHRIIEITPESSDHHEIMSLVNRYEQVDQQSIQGLPLLNVTIQDPQESEDIPGSEVKNEASSADSDPEEGQSNTAQENGDCQAERNTCTQTSGPDLISLSNRERVAECEPKLENENTVAMDCQNKSQSDAPPLNRNKRKTKDKQVQKRQVKKRKAGWSKKDRHLAPKSKRKPDNDVPNLLFGEKATGWAEKENSIEKRCISLREEIVKQLIADEGHVSCYICRKQLKSLEAFVNHLTEHMRKKRMKTKFACYFCGREMSSRQRLFSHLDTHSAVKSKPYSCSKCDKVFKEKQHLQGHERTHTGERPYQCRSCKSSFRTLGQLIKHEQIHIPTKWRTKWRCKICKKTMLAGDKYKIERHNATHAEERQFKCDICKGLFKSKFTLQKHYDSHGNPNHKECKLCRVLLRGNFSGDRCTKCKNIRTKAPSRQSSHCVKNRDPK